MFGSSVAGFYALPIWLFYRLVTPCAGTDSRSCACGCTSTLSLKRSFTGLPRFCLQPRYRSVVCTEYMPQQELNLLQPDYATWPRPAPRITYLAKCGKNFVPPFEEALRAHVSPRGVRLK